jgi:putative hydrolase of the HAD superfamily
LADVILFDFFGTLVAYQADRRALAYPRSHHLVVEWGCELSHDEFVTLWDLASRSAEERTATGLEELRMLDYAIEFSGRCPQALTLGQCAELAETFADEWSRHVRPVEGVADLLVDLATSFRLGIVSNTNNPEMVPRLVERHFAVEVIEMILLSVDHGRRKPHPSIYQAALGELGCHARRAVFVGDSYEADYLGPTAAGMAAFLIDPTCQHPVPTDNRLHTILDLPKRL